MANPGSMKEGRLMSICKTSYFCIFISCLVLMNRRHLPLPAEWAPSPYCELKFLSAISLLPLFVMLEKDRKNRLLLAAVVFCFRFAITRISSDYLEIVESWIILVTGTMTVTTLVVWAVANESHMRPFYGAGIVFLISTVEAMEFMFYFSVYALSSVYIVLEIVRPQCWHNNYRQHKYQVAFFAFTSYFLVTSIWAVVEQFNFLSSGKW